MRAVTVSGGWEPEWIFLAEEADCESHQLS